METTDLINEAQISANCNIKDNQQLKLKKRLQWYTYYIIKYFEEHMNLYLRLLEDEVVKNNSNTKLVSGASAMANLIPGVGKQIASAIKEGELFCYNQKDKRKSRALSELINHFRDNKSETRRNLISAGAHIFSSFEEQFSQFTCKGGNARAMQKLAEEAVRRLFNYTIETGDDKVFDNTFFGKGIVNGKSETYKLKKSGRSVYIKNMLYKTFDIYDKVGISYENDNHELISKRKPNIAIIQFYRKILPWEKVEDFNNWQNESNSTKYDCILTINEELLLSLETYVLSQSPEGEAKLERKNYHEENLQCQQNLHDETIEYLSELLEYFYTEVKEEIAKLENNIDDNFSIADKKNEDQEIVGNIGEEVKTSLADIKYHIDDNNQYKIILQEQNEQFARDLEDIKKGQEKLKKKRLINMNEVKKIVPPKKEIDKAMQKVNETAHSGAKEVEKTAHRVSREADRSARKVGKAFRKLKL